MPDEEANLPDTRDVPSLTAPMPDTSTHRRGVFYKVYSVRAIVNGRYRGVQRAVDPQCHGGPKVSQLLLTEMLHELVAEGISRDRVLTSFLLMEYRAGE